MSAALDRVRAALDAHGCKPTDRGTAKCPAHKDDRASLTFGKGDKGAVLCCHAGCSQEAVVGALGLKMADLFDDAGGNGKRREVAAYDYVDEAGALLFQVVRFEPKDFRQRKPTGNGGLEWKLGTTRRVIYRLPETITAVKAGRIIFVVEGEKDVATLVAWGFDATCNAGGAGKWKPEHSETLRGAHVVIIPDADKPGRDHAASVAASLAGVAAKVKVVELPGAKDTTAWAVAGGTREDLMRLVAAARLWQPPAAGTHVADIACGGPGLREEEVGPVGVLLSEVECERVAWLWPGRIPLGKITVLDGDPGLGKSTLALDLAARVTRGGLMPDGSPGVDGGVVILTAEDGLGDTVRPRLEAAGGDPTRVVALQTVGTGDNERAVSLENLQALEQAIRRVGAKLVIVDPVMAFLGTQTDSHRDQDIRRCLAPLARLAETSGAAFLIIRHLNKASGGNPIYRGGGSIGIIGAARSGLLVSKDPDEEARRVLASTKSNLSRPPESLSFELEDRAGAVRVKWLGASKHSASSLLAESDNEQDRAAVDEAKDFLRDALAGGPQPAKDVQRGAREAGISDATLRRAKSALHVTARKVGRPGMPGQGWVWALPEDDHDPPKVLNPDEMSAFGRNMVGKGSSGNGSAEDAQRRESEHLRGHAGEGGTPRDPEGWGEV